eukprot:TRINITY_DN8730_c0_g1_i1.p1 TRINITY_DN8730_c0_g1~~TRINITY_DN8730_c0_g1_i1.p1  ORF type:complete len:310 (+),score=77.24 TRINITY_DN8730_c0_g1_i1:23-952(+)
MSNSDAHNESISYASLGQYYSETVVSLLQRLTLKPLNFPSFLPLHSKIQSENDTNATEGQREKNETSGIIRSSSTFEFLGKKSSGKTECLINLLSHLLLPNECGGLEEQVFFLDNDSKLNSSRLLGVMESSLLKQKQRSEDELEVILENSMSRLKIAHCFSSVSFLATLQSIHMQYCASEKRTGVMEHVSLPRILMIDNVAAFHYEDRMDGDAGKKRQSKICQLIQVVVQKYNMVLFVTKPIYYKTQMPDLEGKTQRDILPHLWLREIIQKQFVLVNNNNSFSIHHFNPIKPASWNFTIDEEGLEFDKT